MLLKHQFDLDAVARGIRAIRAGEMAVLFDKDREGEGDLVLAAEAVTPEKVNFMITEARGLLCVPLTARRLDELEIPLMAPDGRGSCRFTVSVDARDGITTGSSVPDRTETIRVLARPETTPEALVRPGHVFPLRARRGLLAERCGHTEGSLELVQAAGRSPAAVICEVLNSRGTMADLEGVERFAEQHGLPLLTLGALRRYLYG